MSRIQYFITLLLFVMAVAVKAEEQKKVPTGWRNVSLTHKMFDNDDDYFGTEIVNDIKKGMLEKRMENNVFYLGACWTDGRSFKQCFDYKVTKQSMSIYVPTNYNGKGEWGVFVENSHAERSLDNDLKLLLQKYRLIYVAPSVADPNAKLLTKLAVSMDALASVKKMYKVRSDRVFMGYNKKGTSISALIAAMHPTMVQGVLMKDRVIFGKQSRNGKSTGPGGFEIARDYNCLNFLNEKYVKKHLTAIEWVFWLNEKSQEKPCKRDIAEWEKWGLSVECFLYNNENQGVEKWEGLGYGYTKAFAFFDRKHEAQRLKAVDAAMKESNWRKRYTALVEIINSGVPECRSFRSLIRKR